MLFRSEAYPDGNYPMVPIASRDTFEKVLRKLFYKPGGRIRWLVGTVTSIQSSPEDPSKLSYVTVRSKDQEEELSISATLVVGMYICYFNSCNDD